MATYVIGDVQGCFDELQQLLQLINFEPKQDTLWFAGDLVNRGPKSLEVLRFIRNLKQRAVVVLGNHDLHLLAIINGKERFKTTDTINDILTATDVVELCQWLRHQPLLHHDPVLGYTMVHAGLAPQWDLTLAERCAAEVAAVMQGDLYQEFLTHMYGNEPKCWQNDLLGWERLRFITNCFTRIRFCDAAGNLDLINKGDTSFPGYMPWFKVPNRKHKDLQICFGHWAALGAAQVEPGVFLLDSGCVWGNKLTAMRLEDKSRFSVPCRSYQAIKS
ncbi:symmetrical bis(5'-nucleosyl)-tetraphosphatase [soil metagenome]